MRKTPQRVELKKAYSYKDLDILISKLMNSNLRFYRPYPPRKINSLYFDSSDYSAINESLSGDSLRVKTRLRWYGKYLTPNNPILENKFKNGIYSWKCLQPTNFKYLDNAKDWFSALKQQDSKKEKCIRQMLPINQQTPVSIVSYYRYYYESKDRSVRVTIDKNIEFFDQRTKKAPNLKYSRKINQTIVCEIKIDKKNINKITDFTNEISFQSQRFSKYCESTKFNRIY